MCLYRFFVALDSFVCLCDNSFYSCSHMYLELVSHHFSREDNGKGFYSHLVQAVWFFVFFSSLNIYLSLIPHYVSNYYILLLYYIILYYYIIIFSYIILYYFLLYYIIIL